jgi:hypothetical protein
MEVSKMMNRAGVLSCCVIHGVVQNLSRLCIRRSVCFQRNTVGITMSMCSSLKMHSRNIVYGYQL